MPNQISLLSEPILWDTDIRNANSSRKRLALLSVLVGLGFLVLVRTTPSSHSMKQIAVHAPHILMASVRPHRVTIASQVKTDLSLVKNIRPTRRQTRNTAVASYSPEQLAFIKRKGMETGQKFENSGSTMGMHGAFRTVRTLSLQAADEIAELVIKTCKRNKFKPIIVTVVDSSSDIVVQKRMDGCPSGMFPKFSVAKALTASNFMMPSREFGAKYGIDQPAKLFQGIGMAGIADGALAPFPGGVVIRDKVTSEVLGAVGVSGAAGDEDEYCALAGVHESSLGDIVTTEPRTHSCTTHKD